MDQKMKIKVLYIIDTLNGSGAEQSLAEITSNFKKTEVVFVHLYVGEMLKPWIEKQGIKVYSLNIKSKYGYKTAQKSLTEIYNKEKPDIIHSTLYRADMVARKMKKRYPQIPLIGSFVNNSYTPLRYKNKSILMKIKLWLAYKRDYYTAKSVDYFISNSLTIKKSEGGALKIPENKVKVIYRGRDGNRFSTVSTQEIESVRKELGLGKNNKVLLNVSRLIERKGQLDLIKIFPKVLESNPQSILVFAGHGEYKKVLQKECEKLNIANKVHFLGRRRDVEVLLKLADIFIYPSYAEGLPGALIEAMFAKKIIIASNIGENLECVNSESALIYKKANQAELREKILYALKNLEKLKILGETAQSQAYSKFEINSIAEEYEKTYHDVLS